MITYDCKKSFRKKSLRWIFDNWMGNTALLCDQIERRTCDWYDEPFMPFHDNENSGVSVLLSGSAKAGYLPFAEYEVEKSKRKRDGEGTSRGRADLWFIAGEQAYSFEFKRAWNASTLVSLRYVMGKADEDIARIPDTEFDHAFSGMIAPFFPDEAEEEEFVKFSREVDCCYRIGDEKNYSAFLYFNLRK